MAEETKANDTNKALFTNLIMMLSTSALQQLGKIVNPITNKAEVNLDGARVTIDMLGMLKEKTKGNLDQDEEKILANILLSLQMNYVETSKSATAEPEKKEETKDGTQQAADKQKKGKEGGVESVPKDEEGARKRDPKFHKSYGA